MYICSLLEDLLLLIWMEWTPVIFWNIWTSKLMTLCTFISWVDMYSCVAWLIYFRTLVGNLHWKGGASRCFQGKETCECCCSWPQMSSGKRFDLRSLNVYVNVLVYSLISPSVQQNSQFTPLVYSLISSGENSALAHFIAAIAKHYNSAFLFIQFNIFLWNSSMLFLGLRPFHLWLD